MRRASAGPYTRDFIPFQLRAFDVAALFQKSRVKGRGGPCFAGQILASFVLTRFLYANRYPLRSRTI
jgi:hypothetical protein